MRQHYRGNDRAVVQDEVAERRGADSVRVAQASVRPHFVESQRRTRIHGLDGKRPGEARWRQRGADRCVMRLQEAILARSAAITAVVIAAKLLDDGPYDRAAAQRETAVAADGGLTAWCIEVPGRADVAIRRVDVERFRRRRPAQHAVGLEDDVALGGDGGQRHRVHLHLVGKGVAVSPAVHRQVWKHARRRCQRARPLEDSNDRPRLRARTDRRR